MRTFSILLVALSLAGCATGAWVKPGMTAATFNSDRYQCMRSNTSYVGSGYANGYGASSSFGTAVNPALFSACMSANGYTWVQKQ